jgi:hypothetical protein
MNERSIAAILGILGGVILLIGALVSLIYGLAFVALGKPSIGIGSLGFSVIEAVMGLLIIFFALLAASRSMDLTLAGGIVLFVLAIVGWGILGFGGSVLATIGLLLALVAGLLYLVAAMSRGRWTR